MKYREFEDYLDVAEKGKICIFGAGLYGTTWVYGILRAMEAQVDFYCDNKKQPGVEIKEGVKTISPQELYSLHDNVTVFVAVSYRYQDSIREQLKENGIVKFMEMDQIFLQEFMEDIIEKNDPQLNEKFKFIINDEDYLSTEFEYHMGYRPNLENPRTFNEKIQWLKLHVRNPEYVRMADKYEVKKYITEKIGEKYVIPTLGLYETFDEIDFEKLPRQFVLKCTHDSGSTVVCRDKNSFDIEKARTLLERNLKYNYYWAGREWQYKDIKPRIIAEQYLEDTQDRELRDYKFFCFHGIAKVLLIAQGRMSSDREVTTDFFNERLEHMEMRSGHKNGLVLPHMPEHYLEMKETAEKLSLGIPHVRVDFYEVNGQVYLGEFTFHHQGGMVPLEPYERDIELGNWIHLDLEH